MTVLHAIWADAHLHVWAERIATENASPTSDPQGSDYAVEADELRSHLGDAWDSLLVSGATTSAITLLLPHVDKRPLRSSEVGVADQDGPSVVAAERVRLIPRTVPTLRFAPADAVDLLTTSPSRGLDNLRDGASIGYWSRVAELVLSLLARQRFVPAIFRLGEGSYRGYWRAIVSDEPTARHLETLIASMPLVCRSQSQPQGQPLEASSLVENFLWTTVDALVRRCLEGDELAHALHERPCEAGAPEMLWLQSLVRTDGAMSGSQEDCTAITNAVEGWLSRLDSSSENRACRTCFCLHAPRPPSMDAPVEVATQGWQLTLHVQALQDPSLMLDAISVWEQRYDNPMILDRPFRNAREQLLADVAHAGRHFAPLKAYPEAARLGRCQLSLEEAYQFLRDAAPLLEMEGFGVTLPPWWREDRPRLRMNLDLHPLDGDGSSSTSHMRLDSLVGYDWRVALGDERLDLEEIARLAISKTPLVQLHGKWTEVQPTDLDTAMRFLESHPGGNITVLEALRQCYIADDLETGLPVAGIQARGWIDRLLHASHVDQKLDRLDPPRDFKGELRPYQLRGLEWLNFLSTHGLGACLADDMGLGKTIQLISLLLHERQDRTPPGPTLLVVPMSLVGNWQREILRFGPSLSVMVHHGLDRLTGQAFADGVAEHNVVISTYGLTHRDRDHLARVEWHRIALDEAQNIKNPAAKQAVAIRSLHAVHRVALTGTPVENRLSELWSIMDFLNAGYLGSAMDFRRRFAVPIERHHDEDRATRLRHLIQPFVLRRLKSDPGILTDLPEKMEMKVFCNLTREQAALYEALVSEMLAQIDQTGGIQRRGLILATLVKLKQICNHPAHFLADESSLAHRSGKCDRLMEMLEEVVAEGDRALVFTQFRRMAELLQPYLQDALGVDVLLFHGGTTQKQRDRLVERFQDPTDRAGILLLSLKAGGVGLNLTAANHVFHYDRWWNPAVEDQASDRAHRIGQIKTVQVHKFICLGTVEERIDDLIEQKRDLARNIVGTGEQWVTELTTTALRELFALSREAVAEE